jgi:hypothetical protein
MAIEPPAWAKGPHDDVLPWVEVCLNDDGTIDEILTDRPVRFHLEQMGDGKYWIGLTSGKERQCVMLTRRGNGVYPTVFQ